MSHVPYSTPPNLQFTSGSVVKLAPGSWRSIPLSSTDFQRKYTSAHREIGFLLVFCKNYPLLSHFSPPVFIRSTSFLFCCQALYYLVMIKTLRILIYSWVSLYIGRLEKIYVFFPPPSQVEKNKCTGELYHKIMNYFVTLLLSNQRAISGCGWSFYKSLLITGLDRHAFCCGLSPSGDHSSNPSLNNCLESTPPSLCSHP